MRNADEKVTNMVEVDQDKMLALWAALDAMPDNLQVCTDHYEGANPAVHFQAIVNAAIDLIGYKPPAAQERAAFANELHKVPLDTDDPMVNSAGTLRLRLAMHAERTGRADLRDVEVIP